MVSYKTEKGKPHPCGATVVKDGVMFAAECKNEDCGVILKDIKTSQIIRIPFGKENKVGNIYSITVKYLDFDKYVYKFYDGLKEITDPYSRWVTGNEKFGIKKENYELYSHIVHDEKYDWENDIKPNTSFEESILYLLHVRGFSAHQSSKVTGKGTVTGLVQKIPYLKELGITAIEIMPAYEFEEYDKAEFTENGISSNADIAVKDKLNYWGFKTGFYFAPKASYCMSKDPVREYKDFVREFHKNGLEIIMQFYFPNTVGQYRIMEVLRYWLMNYHIDGFHLKGNNIPLTMIAKDPLFSETKLFYDYIPENEIYEASYIPASRNLCAYSDSFMYQMRKVLKGDEDTLKDLVYFTRFYPQKSACVNFITNYYGFTLNDLVSYDRKHNDENGEKNADGCDYNFSWNCGIEGRSQKSSIVKLRKRMMKNALFLVFSSKGTPLIYAGDELCNTQNGNNNPYCQDNSTSYINWNMNAQSSEMLEYVKELIKLRKNDLLPVLNREFSMLDRAHIGFPDLSYHSDEAWKADLANYNRHLGIMYSDCDKDGKTVTLYYAAYNFYWKEISFNLPYLPSKAKWTPIFSTGETKEKEKDDKKQGMIFELESRSCSLFKASFLKSDITEK
ncbi:MAG: hypothetical protein K6G75_01775 [Lachnospiraceae bacterium]|nr:hypothetical protein [Lachnospiraceae bacterium]